MPKACAKAVQTVGKVCWSVVGVRPQNLWEQVVWHKNTAENPQFLPELSNVFAHRNPQAKSLVSYLLSLGFSPLSTQPITITTNLKTKKGNN